MVYKPLARKLLSMLLPLTIIFLTRAVTAQTPHHTPTQTTEQPQLPINIPVLRMQYYPRDPVNPDYLDDIETGWTNILVSNMESATDSMVAANITTSGQATRFRGHLNPAAPQYLQFSVIDSLTYYEAMPRGYQLSSHIPEGEDSVTIRLPNGDEERITQASYRPHYNQILTDINICDYVDAQGVKEVWMYGYHSDFIVPDESKMSSRYGDVSNAWPKDEQIPAEFRLPRCDNSFVIYNFTYQPGGALAYANTVHNRMHQIENAVAFAEGFGWPPNEAVVEGTIFWDDFSVYGNRGSLPGYRASCGNSHSPPNTFDGYDYNDPAVVENNCETWHIEDYLTTYVDQDCSTWGCTDIGFYTWFMHNIPGYNNQITQGDCTMRNWWDAMVDFNAFIDAGYGLMTCPTSQNGPWLAVSFDDSSFTGDDGEVGTANGVTFVDGHNGSSASEQAVLINDMDTLTYETQDNIDLPQGSIEFWLKPTWAGNDNNNYVLFEIGDSWFNRMRIMKDGANNFRFMVWSNDAEYDAAHNIGDWTADSWHKVRVEWDETNLKLYLDDSLEDTQPEIALPTALAPTMYIGSTYTGSQQANAVIDDFVINGPLTDVPTSIAFSESTTTAETVDSLNLVTVALAFMIVSTLIIFKLRKPN